MELDEVLKPKSIQAKNQEYYVFLPNDLIEIEVISEINRTVRFNEAVASKNAGNASFLEKKYGDAIDYYGRAIEILEKMDNKVYGSALSVCYQNRSAAKAYKKDYVDSIVDASKAIELNHHYSKAYYRRALAYYNQKKYYRALQDIMQACVIVRFINKTYIDLVGDILDWIDLAPLEVQWERAYEEMGVAELHCDHCLKQQLTFVKNCGIIDEIIVTVPKSQPSSGYILAMKGLKESNTTDIMDGCNEEAALKGKYLAHSYILKAYMNLVVISSPSDAYGEWSKDMQRMDQIISDEGTPENIKFNAILCRANLYNRSGQFSNANRDLDSLKDRYGKTGPYHITKSGALFQFALSKPEFYEALKTCCQVLPDVFELHFQKANADAKQITNPILSTTYLMLEFEELIKRFPKEVGPRMMLITLYDKFDKEKAKRMLKKAIRDLPEHSNEMISLNGILNPTDPSCVTYFKQALQFNKDDPCSLEGLLDYFESTTYEYAKAIEVYTKGMYNFLQKDDFENFFKRRQALLQKIVYQNFWDHL